MKSQILIGMLVASSLLVSCSVEQDEGTPITVADDVTTSIDEFVDRPPANDDIGDSGGVQGSDHPVPATRPTTTMPPAQEPDQSESVTTTTPGDSIDETPELPVPGGPLVHPREPDFTKTTPPPRD